MKPTINLHSISVPSVRLPDGTLSAPLTQDMSDYQGRTARVYLSAAGQIEINPQRDSYWLVAEVVLPPAATRQIQNGTRIETVAATQQVKRDATNTDTVQLAAGQRIGRVGFAWSPFVRGTDYTDAGGVITWLGNGRQPQAGQQYPVDVLTDNPVPVMEQRALPLDLAQHAVTLFDLPQ